MARALRSKAIKIIAAQRAEDEMWGIPESPEVSSVQRLMNEIQAHAAHEAKWLAGYQVSAKESNDPLIRFLLGLIVADEERHHEITARMIAKLNDELTWTRSSGTQRRAGEKSTKRKSLLNSVESFLEAERSGVKEYEKLKKKSHGLYRDVFALLYMVMIHDSLKHIEILEFLRQRLKEGRHSPRKTISRAAKDPR
jgi:hypothetical protein